MEENNSRRGTGATKRVLLWKKLRWESEKSPHGKGTSTRKILFWGSLNKGVDTPSIRGSTAKD